MDSWITLQRRMAQAASDLHRAADDLVETLVIKGALTDDEEAALDGARRWRSICEQGE